jgi:ABC-type antimicrobial peptide transport system permease subunit
VILLSLILLCCLFAEVIMTKDPGYLDLQNYNQAPNGAFLFGTDTLGRDIFSGIWYGGRISIAIGFLATLISTLIAVVYGSVSGTASGWVDAVMMRFTDDYLDGDVYFNPSVPGLNLLRARNQMILAKDILAKQDALADIVENEKQKIK